MGLDKDPGRNPAPTDVRVLEASRWAAHVALEIISKGLVLHRGGVLRVPKLRASHFALSSAPSKGEVTRRAEIFLLGEQFPDISFGE